MQRNKKNHTWSHNQSSVFSLQEWTRRLHDSTILKLDQRLLHTGSHHELLHLGVIWSKRWSTSSYSFVFVLASPLCHRLQHSPCNRSRSSRCRVSRRQPRALPRTRLLLIMVAQGSTSLEVGKLWAVRLLPTHYLVVDGAILSSSLILGSLLWQLGLGSGRRWQEGVSCSALCSLRWQQWPWSQGFPLRRLLTRLLLTPR